MEYKVNIQQSLDEMKSVKSLIEQVTHEGMVIVEVGSFEGGNIIFLGGLIKDIPSAVVIAVDIWQDRDKLISFFTNVSSVDYTSHIRAIWMYSHEAVHLFNDKSLDMVYIDADHSYSNVVRDVTLWMPKVRSGGILSGHDCEKKFTNYPEDQQREIEFHKEDDLTPFSCHAGVVKALYDIFNDDYEKGLDRIWYKKVA